MVRVHDSSDEARIALPETERELRAEFDTGEWQVTKHDDLLLLVTRAGIGGQLSAKELAVGERCFAEADQEIEGEKEELIRRLGDAGS